MTETGGFLNDLAGTDPDPFFIANGKYAGYVFKSEVSVSQSGAAKGKRQWVITYKIADNDPSIFKGKVTTEFYVIETNPDPAKNEIQRSYQKKRAMSLGATEEQFLANTLTPAFFVGKPVWFTIGTKKGYQNVIDVVLRDETTGAAIVNPGLASSAQSASIMDQL